MQLEQVPFQRRSDTPEYARLIETDYAKARTELAALVIAVSTLTTECANLRHQIYAKDQELATLRKLHAAAITTAFFKGLTDEPA